MAFPATLGCKPCPRLQGTYFHSCLSGLLASTLPPEASAQVVPLHHVSERVPAVLRAAFSSLRGQSPRPLCSLHDPAQPHFPGLSALSPAPTCTDGPLVPKPPSLHRAPRREGGADPSPQAPQWGALHANLTTCVSQPEDPLQAQSPSNWESQRRSTQHPVLSPTDRIVGQIPQPPLAQVRLEFQDAAQGPQMDGAPAALVGGLLKNNLLSPSAPALVTKKTWGLKDRRLSPTVLGAGRPRSRCQPVRLVLEKTFFEAPMWMPSCCMLERGHLAMLLLGH